MPNRLKVLMVGILPPDLKSVRGGVEAAIINLFSGFSQLDEIEVVHLAFSKDVSVSSEVHFAPNVRILFIPFRVKYPLLDYWLNRKELKDIIDREAPQIIHIQEADPHLLRFLGFSRKNIVVTQHGIKREEAKYARGIAEKSKFFFKSLIERYVFPTFGNIIFISDYNRKLFKGTVSNSCKIYNAVDPSFFASTAAAWQSRNSIIYVGVISRRKNLKIVIQALHELKQQQIKYHLHVVGGYKEGETAYEREINDLVKSLDMADQITFHGWLKQNEILQLYQQCTFFVLPSNQETLPVSIAEAMALGKIVIASDVGAVSEMFEDEVSGFLFGKNDLKRLVELLSALSLNEKLEELSRNSKLSALEKYHPVSNARKTLAFYRQVKETK